MGRPRRTSTEPAGPETGYAGGGATDPIPSTAPYPPMENQNGSEPYPPTQSVPYPPMENQSPPGPYPPAQSVPYPPMENQSAPGPYPPAQSVPHPPPPQTAAPVVDGTPVSFPPAGHAVTPQHINISAASPYPQHIGDPWSSRLFDWNMNETNAVMTAFFPCVTFGQIAEILDEGQTTCILGSFMYVMMVPALLTCWILGSNYRQKMRQKYGLVQAPYEDWATHLFCPCCALCQEYRELEKRGFDPSLGWMGHLARQQQTQTTPPTNQFMNN